jgi:hypothetical protein
MLLVGTSYNPCEIARHPPLDPSHKMTIFDFGALLSWTSLGLFWIYSTIMLSCARNTGGFFSTPKKDIILCFLHREIAFLLEIDMVLLTSKLCSVAKDNLFQGRCCSLMLGMARCRHCSLVVLGSVCFNQDGDVKKKGTMLYGFY